MYQGNVAKVIADAEKIARRWAYDDVPIRQLMAEYHCSYCVIVRVIRSQISKYRWKKIRKKHLLKGNTLCHLEKGHIPWNKGISYNAGGRSIETQFKKGNLPANHKKLGTITIRKDKSGQYRMIAVLGLTAHRHKWIPFAQYLYEKKNGPIPNGYFVVHADGNRLNDDPNNFQLVDRKGNLELMRENNPGWKKKAIRSLKKTVRIRRMKKIQEQREVERRQIRQQQQTQLEAEQKKIAEQQMLEIYGPQVCVWECTNCSAEYEQKNMPGKCIKCGRFSFEKNFYRRKTG